MELGLIFEEKYYFNGWGGWGLANATTLHWNVRFSALFVIPSLKILWHWDNISVYVWVFFCGMMMNNQGGIDDHWRGINRHYINWFYHATYLATKQWQSLVFMYMHTMQRNKYEGHFLEKCKKEEKSSAGWGILTPIKSYAKRNLNTGAQRILALVYLITGYKHWSSHCIWCSFHPMWDYLLLRQLFCIRTPVCHVFWVPKRVCKCNCAKINVK